MHFVEHRGSTAAGRPPVRGALPVRWLLAAGLLAVAYSAGLDVAQAQQAAPVVAAQVQQQVLQPTRSFVGTVTPMRKAAVGSAVDGRVLEFPVNEGDRVDQGAPLAQLKTETITAQLDAATADLELRKSELAELEAGSRPEEKRQAAARVAAAKARMEYADANLRRTESLFRMGSLATKEQYDEALSLASSTQQAYLEAIAAQELVELGPRKEQKDQAAARVAAQEALVRQITDQRVKHTMFAPFPGYISAEYTEVGQWVNRGELVAEVVYLDEVDILVHLPEDYVSYLAVDQELEVEAPALGNRRFPGRVALIVPQGDSRSRTFPVKVRVTNEIGPSGPVLKGGMLARVNLPTSEARQVLTVPKDALVLGGPAPAVYVIELDPPGGQVGKVRPAGVATGSSHGDRIEVTGSLKPGQWVVVQGNERLRPGQEVQFSPQAADARQASSKSDAPRSPAGR